MFSFPEGNKWTVFCILRKSFFWEGEDIELWQTVIIIKQNKMMMHSHMSKNSNVAGFIRCSLISRAVKKILSPNANLWSIAMESKMFQQVTMEVH